VSLRLWVCLDQLDVEVMAAATLRAALPAERLHPAARLTLMISQPYTPRDLFRHGSADPPRLRLMALRNSDRRGRTLDPLGEEALSLAPQGPVARGGLPWVEELGCPALSKALGACLLLCWEESPSLAYAALYRQGRCQWSLALRPFKDVVRFDGGRAWRDKGRLVADGDRAEIIRLGVEKLLTEPLPMEPDEALILPDLLLEALMDAHEEPLTKRTNA
jgi:hypothetical protein